MAYYRVLMTTVVLHKHASRPPNVLYAIMINQVIAIAMHRYSSSLGTTAFPTLCHHHTIG
jgi:hypothetical protein